MAKSGVRVNSSSILSKVGFATASHYVAAKPEVKRIIDLHPMKRLGKANEIANGFVFLASDDSSFVSGTALEIDGGYLAL